jgi:hypothetical protein
MDAIAAAKKAEPIANPKAKDCQAGRILFWSICWPWISWWSRLMSASAPSMPYLTRGIRPALRRPGFGVRASMAFSPEGRIVVGATIGSGHGVSRKRYWARRRRESSVLCRCISSPMMFVLAGAMLLKARIVAHQKGHIAAGTYEQSLAIVSSLSKAAPAFSRWRTRIPRATCYPPSRDCGDGSASATLADHPAREFGERSK